MLKVSRTLKLFLGSIILLGYFSILIYTPIHMIKMADMNMPMEHCPFVINQYVICTITISEHIREWQNWLQNFLPSFKTTTSAILFFTLSYIITSPSILRLLLYCKQQHKVRTFSFLQILFSQGILHSKAY